MVARAAAMPALASSAVTDLNRGRRVASKGSLTSSCIFGAGGDRVNFVCMWVDIESKL